MISSQYQILDSSDTVVNSVLRDSNNPYPPPAPTPSPDGTNTITDQSGAANGVSLGIIIGAVVGSVAIISIIGIILYKVIKAKAAINI